MANRTPRVCTRFSNQRGMYQRNERLSIYHKSTKRNIFWLLSYIRSLTDVTRAIASARCMPISWNLLIFSRSTCSSQLARNIHAVQSSGIFEHGEGEIGIGIREYFPREEVKEKRKCLVDDCTQWQADVNKSFEDRKFVASLVSWFRSLAITRFVSFVCQTELYT